MDLDEAHQEDSTVATPVSSRYQTMCMRSWSFTFLFVIYVLSYQQLSSCGTPPIFYVSSANCSYHFWLINHDNRKKISVYIHHMSLATFATVATFATFVIAINNYNPQLTVHNAHNELHTFPMA
jgi:hypothetical protein